MFFGFFQTVFNSLLSDLKFDGKKFEPEKEGPTLAFHLTAHDAEILRKMTKLRSDSLPDS